jgi:hypothetical protein
MMLSVLILIAYAVLRAMLLSYNVLVAGNHYYSVICLILLICAIRCIIVRKYLIDFDRRKIYFGLFPFVNIPRLSFSDIGGIDRRVIPSVSLL